MKVVPTVRYFGPCRKQRQQIAALHRRLDAAVADNLTLQTESVGVRTVLHDLVDAVRSSGAADAVVSNDLGNAMQKAEEVLRR